MSLSVSSGLDPNQVRLQHSVGSDLGPKCFAKTKVKLADKELNSRSCYVQADLDLLNRSKSEINCVELHDYQTIEFLTAS